ncbi:Glycosyl transferase, group 1 [Methanosarcina barkeri str. Wiesmoor]|uniref:Glycosyl transferase, group 1 n=3 Tax=Methanosarcina barkeri TaxID=2208 RepID=A0A0E3QKV6_METBA|nr:Glycosyl transferase, group 1 [Methanosarcina barkeri str. Wiesmoor]
MIRVFMCGPISSSGGVSTHTKYITKCLSKLGVKVTLYNFISENKYLFKSISLDKFYRRTIGLFYTSVSHRKEYDVLHVQASGGIFSFISSITASIVSKITNKKLVVTFHHSKTEEFVKKYKSLFNFVLRNTNVMVLVSNKQKDFISKMFPKDSHKLIVIPNGYDSTLFFPRDANECRKVLNIPINKKVVFNVSNLVEIKGHRYLIEAIGDIVKKRSDIYCIIGGRGYLKEELEQQIRESKLENYVKLVGWIRDEDVPIYINASDLFVLPSLGEGNPIVMFEAIGCGRQFIGTKVGGIPEVITSEDYGLLVEPGNSQALAEKIESALYNNEKNKKNIKNVEQYRWDNVAEQTKQIYCKLEL